MAKKMSFTTEIPLQPLTHPLADGVIQLPWASMHTFLVEMQLEGEGLAWGTCLTVSHEGQWFVVTNRHNVTGRNQYSGKPMREDQREPDQLAIVLPTDDLGNLWYIHGVALYDSDGRPTWTEHPVLGGQVDVVALPFDKPIEGKCFGAMLGDKDDFAVGIGDPLHTIGYRGAEPLFSIFPQWIECSLATSLLDTWEGLPAFLIDGRLAKGSSGSPVVAYRENAEELTRSDGSVIGSNWASRILGVYSGSVSPGVGLVWNLECVREIVEHAMADRVE